jgi:hypothetical protein
MKNIKQIIFLFLILTLMCGRGTVVRADDVDPIPEVVPPPVVDVVPPPAPHTPAPQTATILIRNGDTLVYQGAVDLPAAGEVSVTDDAGVTHLINSDSVLGVLYSLSHTSGAFSLSDIQYYASFGSLYLKCLTPSGGVEACDNWQYIVNGSTPSSGADTTVLSGGETVGLYFGSFHHVVRSATAVSTGESFTATAEKYNYLDNTWSPLSGVTIGVTVPNPNDPYSPTLIVSHSVDETGSAIFTLADAGVYTVGISDDYYFPSYTVTASAPVHSSSGSGGGGGGGVPPPPAFSVPDALAYLTRVQSSDGSFGGSDMYSDWVAIAFGAAATPDNTVEMNLLNYMSTHTTVSPLLTDNERHAMALLALRQNPYSFYSSDYIAPIMASFDGVQFGDPALVNDDIFALIPLSSSGYTASDSMITKDVAFILAQQKSDGSWGESVDMTAAAVLALKAFDMVAGVSGSISSAGVYLQNAQASDGGFGSIYSTSWVAQAMQALGASWMKNGYTIATYFAAQQARDGAALPLPEALSNRIWATSYAIPAVLGKPWGVVMRPVTRPLSQTISPPTLQSVTAVAPVELLVAPVLKPVSPRTTQKHFKKVDSTITDISVPARVQERPESVITVAVAQGGVAASVSTSLIAAISVARLKLLSLFFSMK